MSWAFNPNHTKRIGAIWEYYNRTRTENDSFIAGNSGAGYVNPTRLIKDRISGLPSARDIWIEHNLKYFRQTNIKITGFIIDGFISSIPYETDEMYTHFSGDGTFSQPYWYPQGDHMVGTMPALVQQGNLDGNVRSAAPAVISKGKAGQATFVNYRTIQVTPTYVKDLYAAVVAGDNTKQWALVDTRTYTALARKHMGVTPDYRATYTFDTLPDYLEPDTTVNVFVGVRNDGWVDWKASGDSAVSLRFQWVDGDTVVATQFVAISEDIASGDGLVLEVALKTPSGPGEYKLVYEMTRNGLAFTSKGDYAWEKTVSIIAPSAGTTLVDAKKLTDGTAVTLSNCIVTAGTDQFDHTFYIQDPKRISGIRVFTGDRDIDVSEGDRVTVSGVINTESTERELISPVITSIVSSEPLNPVAMLASSIGGTDLHEHTPGFANRIGLHNTGLLVRVYGRVRYANSSKTFFVIDDGSYAPLSSTINGVCVDYTNLASGNSIAPLNVGDYVVITGISTRIQLGGNVYPSVSPRKQSDVQVVLGE